MGIELPPSGSDINYQSDQLSQAFLQTNPLNNSPVQMDRDTHGTNFLHTHALFSNPDIKFGRIQYSMPYVNWYRVALESPGGVIPCAKLFSDTGCSTIGPRETSLLPPDSPVFVLIHPSSLYGYIIGTVPAQMADANFAFSDWIIQGSNVGLHKDAHHNQMLSLLEDEGGVRDFSAGKPVDQLSFDWGRMTETGVGIHIDPAMFFLRIDELCGIYGYQQDQMLRIAGYNMDVWSAVHTVEIRDDEGEATYFRGETPYPWEMLGAFKFNEPVHLEITDEDVIYKKPQAKFEPIEDCQIPFYRYREYGGYTGQGRIREIAIPPKTAATAGKLNTPPDDQAGGPSFPAGVFRESISLDGTYALQSAKAVILSKSTLIPAPQRVTSQEDYAKEGDNDRLQPDSVENDNYQFAGQHGDAGGGDDAVLRRGEHKVGDLITNSDTPTLLTAAAVLEMHAYTFNWKAIHAFHYHAGDYVLPEVYEAISSTGSGYGGFLPAFDGLVGDQMWLDRPSPKTAYVDHRYEEVNYYNATSHVTLAEDGAVVIQGGQGEEIRMVGGSIQMSCPGNIFLQPGKSLIALGGDDVVIRARKSVDITATENDVRLKAENNLQMLAANSGDGTLLIESRSEGGTNDFSQIGGEEIDGKGIILKATDQIATMSKELYLRTGSNDGDISPGQICLDADKGNGTIRSMANSQVRYLSDSSVDVFGAKEGNRPTQVNKFGLGDTLLGSGLRILGGLQSTGSAVFSGRVASVNAHFASLGGGHVDRLLDRDLLKTLLARAEEEHNANKDSYRQDWSTFINKAFYDEKETGNADVQKSASFSFRTKEQYSTSDFILPQTHWQTLNEVVDAGEAWEENDVKYGKYGPRQPWPGKEAWESDTLLRLESDKFKIHDLKENIPKSRWKDGYEDREYVDFTKSAPSEHYKILSNK